MHQANIHDTSIQAGFWLRAIETKMSQLKKDSIILFFYFADKFSLTSNTNIVSNQLMHLSVNTRRQLSPGQMDVSRCSFADDTCGNATEV